MKKLPILLFVLLFVSRNTIHAQSKEVYNPSEPACNTFALKGFAMPTYFLTNAMNGSIGFEYGFLRRHAIGISFSYAEDRTQFSNNDSVQKTLGYPNRYSVDRGLFVYYRYYAKKWNSYRSFIYRPYLSGFVRAGNQDRHFDDNYETGQIKYDEQQLSVGTLIGAVVPLQVAGLCVDVHAGPFYKMRYIRDEYRENGQDIVGLSQSGILGLKVGVTLSYLFRRGLGGIGG